MHCGCKNYLKIAKYNICCEAFPLLSLPPPPALSPLPSCSTYSLQLFLSLSRFLHPPMPRTGQSLHKSCPHLSAGRIAFLLHFSRSLRPSTAHIIRILSFLGFRQGTEASSWPCHATPLGLQLTIAVTTNSYLVQGVLSAQGYCSPGVSLPLNLASGLFSLQYRNCIHQGWFVLSLPTHSSSLRVLLCFTSQWSLHLLPVRIYL